MASTYSNLKIELIGTGDQSGTWGVTTNTNLGTAIEEAITGTADVSFSSADVTLTLSNTNTTQAARNLRLNLIGTVGAPQNLIVPAIEKQYIINNTLGFAITVKNSTGTGVAVPAGKSVVVFNTGANVVDAITALGTGTVLPVGNGGTNASTASITSFNNITGYTASGATGTTSTNLVFSASPALTGTPTTPTAAPGTNTTQIASTAFVGAAVTAATGSLGTMSTQNANAVAITGGTVTGITDLAVADGGTGTSSITANSVILGNGTSELSGNLVAPGASGNVLRSNGTTWQSAAPATPFSWNVTYSTATVTENNTYTIPANCIQVNGYVASGWGSNTGSLAKLDIRNSSNAVLGTVFAGVVSGNDGGAGATFYYPVSLPISSTATNILLTRSSGGQASTLFITSFVTRA